MSDDFSDIYSLAADLTDVPSEANRRVVQAMKFSSVEMKEDWAQGAATSGLESYSKSIDFDISFTDGAIESEIGPNLSKRQGMFGFVEDAGGDVRSAPQHAGRDALEANEDEFYRGLEIAAANALIDKVEKG